MRLFDQVDGVPLEGLELLFRILIRHPGASANRLERAENGLFVHGIEIENLLGLRLDGCQCQQQVLRRDEFILHLGGPFGGSLEDLAEFPVGLRFIPAGRFGEAVQLGPDDLVELGPVCANLVEDRPDDSVGFLQQGGHQMNRIDLRIAMFRRQRLRLRNRFLRSDRQFVESESHE